MLPILLFVLGSATITVQETAGGLFSTIETSPTTYTTDQIADTDETSPTFQTTLPRNALARQSPKLTDDPGCKNQLLCVLQRKSTQSKGFPPVPSKNLVPPYTDAEEEELKTTETSKTTLNEAETESAFPTTLISKPTSVRSVKTPIVLQQREKSSHAEKVKPEASNELRSYLSPANLSPSAAQVDLSYLPPKGVLPAAAAASLDIARVNYLPPDEVKPAAAQNDFTQVKPESPRKDICSDAFHSFLCTPLKSRKRITGALPNGLVPNPAASNTVQKTISTAKPTTPPPTKETHLPFTTKATTTAATTPGYAPQPSNVDRSYLPPAPKTFDTSPSFNSINVLKPNQAPAASTRKPFSTSTPRPFVQTSIVPFISPKVIEQINLTPGRPKPTSATPRLFPEPSNDVNKSYLPPAKGFIQKSSPLPTFRQRTPTVQIVAETRPATTTAAPNKNYLPPSPQIEPAAAAQFSQAVAPANRIAVPHHDHHDHHHGKDICSDPFHSFLCAPLKQRRRITGALPPGFNPQSSNRKETRVKPESNLKPENTFQSERRIKPTEEIPAANVLSPQTAGYQYPKPSTPRPTSGYQYPKPSQQITEIIPKEDRLSPRIASPPGYQYPKPSVPFLLPSESQQSQPSAFPISSPSTLAPSTTPSKSGYQYPKPTNPFLLPSESQQNKPSAFPVSSPSTPAPSVKPQNTGYQYPKPTVPFLLPSESRQNPPSTIKPIPSTSVPAPSLKPQASDQRIGYQYPKPSIPFLLPSESQQNKPSTPKPLQPQPSDQRIGYQYSKPAREPTLSSGYHYPKPENQLVLPSEQKSLGAQPLKDFGSAEFIPVNKIDAKRQVRTGVAGTGPRFGERIRSRVRQAKLAA